MKGHQHPGAAAARIAVPEQTDPATDLIRWLAQMQTDLAASLGGVMLQGALPVPVGTAPGGSPRPLSSPGRVVGWSIHETGGVSPALVRIWDGREAGTKPIAYIQVAAGATVNHWQGFGGVSVTDALLVEVVSGAAEGVVYLGAVD